MHRALARALLQHDRALLIGSDVPGLDAACLRQADAALATHDAVFVPALDGGYALVGLRRPAPQLFEGMAWSTPQVMQHTRQRAAASGLRVAELVRAARHRRARRPGAPAARLAAMKRWLRAQPR